MSYASSSQSVIPAFFARLEAIFSSTQDRVRALELRERCLARTVADDERGVIAEAAENILEEVSLMNKKVEKCHVVAKERSDTMESFLEDAVRQFNEMKETVQKYEAWGAQYGYERQFTLELNLENALEGKSEELQVLEEKIHPRDTGAPSLLDFNLSKYTLSKMGYKFKEDVANISLDSELTYSSYADAKSHAASFHSNLEDTFFSAHEDTPPVSILKKRPPVSPPPLLQEVSVFEISPGLFVRRPNPKARSSKKPIAVKDASQITPAKGMQSQKKKGLTPHPNPKFVGDSPGTPKPPQLSASTLAMLNKKGFAVGNN